MESHSIKEEVMNLINLIVWLSAGVIIGWFACRMVEAEKWQAVKKTT
jgi:hypothetical protein